VSHKYDDNMLKPKQVEKLKKMRAEGWGYRPIGIELGCHRDTVRNWCIKLGLTKNPRYGRKDESTDTYDQQNNTINFYVPFEDNGSKVGKPGRHGFKVR
jgi:hypothetical protein